MRSRQKNIWSFGLFLSMILLLFICSFNTVSGQTSPETFNASTTWTAPVGVTSVEVECWGAGGSGGSSANNDSSGGGGGGAYSRSLSIVVVPGNNYTINVGIGGAAPGRNTSGDVGGDTWFLSNSTVFAKGGSGGTSAGSGGAGGLGGDAGVGIGNDVTFSGGDGAAGTTVGGGGGYGAGSVAGGTQATGSTGGIAPFEGGNGGDGGDNANGSPGIIPGGAGGGSSERNNLGAAGADGQIRLTYTEGAVCNLTSAGLSNISCNDEGTSSIPSDDTFSFDLNPTGTDLGATYSVSGGYTQANVSYGSATTFSGSLISNGNLTITITDDTTGACEIVDLPVTAPASCSSACNLTSAGLSNILCNDEGTSSIPSDDTFSFDLNPTGTDLGATYSVSGGYTQANVSYGSATTFSGSLISNGSLTITITDDATGACEIVDLPVPAPASCSSACNLTSAGLSNILCNDEGTSSIPSDDTFSFDLNPTGTDLGATYSVSGGYTQANVSYGSATTFSGSLISNGSLTITITDDATGACEIVDLPVPAPASCSSACNLTSAGLSNILCNNEGTLSNSSDDTFSFDLDPTGNNLGSTYSVSGGYTQANVSYGSATTFSGSLISNGNLTITITDDTTGACEIVDLPVTAPAPCSSVSNPPTISLGTISPICSGTSSVNLPYSSTTYNPDKYSIDFIDASFTDVFDDDLPASPIIIDVPIDATADVYSAILTVRNSSTGLSSVNYVIKVRVSETPPTPILSGSTTVPENSDGFKYRITNPPSDATGYNWNVPSGWTITAGSTTSQITVKTGALGENGNITLTVDNPCGTSLQGNFAVTVSLTTDHSLYNCTSCHITHNAPGSTLTNVKFNALLCQSCHSSTGAASAKAIVNADNGTSSHAWDVLAVNDPLETKAPLDPEMAMRIVDNKIVCSTCHNQHNTSVGTPHLRISNSGDALCKDCHRDRNVGIYSDAPSTNKGSHPVGITYDGGDSRFNASPTNTQLVGGNVECSSCHGVHDVTGTLGLAANGNLLRTTNDANLCKDCHNYGDHNGMDCLDCHDVHNLSKTNIMMIRDLITNPTLLQDLPVVFTSRGTDAGGTALNSFADGDTNYNGICEVCHSNSSSPTPNHPYNSPPDTADNNHYSGQNCTVCHPHSENFTPAGGCTECHQTAFPNWGITDAHFEHTSKYSFSCSTCHLNYGSGGSLEPSHPDSTLDTDNTMITPVAAEINFDTAGMTTRNGQDANTPIFNGDKTCDNIYCHSTGNTADRGGDGTYDWGLSGLPFGTMTYATTPSWDAGTITACTSCHAGTGNMNAPYTISPPGASAITPPATGEHQKGAHTSMDDYSDWTVVNCFNCHNTNGAASSADQFQGSYGTAFHVDGETLFDPRKFADGGTMINETAHAADAHCAKLTGGGKHCW